MSYPENLRFLTEVRSLTTVTLERLSNHYGDINEIVIKMIIGFMSKITALQLHYTVTYWYISLMSAA